MKKILSLIICLILICSFSVTAFAAGATATFQITVTMDKNTAETYTGDFVLTVTATSAE